MIAVRTVDSKNPKFKSNSKFNFTDLLVVANAVFRKNGYVKTADVPHIVSEGEAVNKVPNVVIVRHILGVGKKHPEQVLEFINSLDIDTNQEDADNTSQQIKFFKGLLIKGMKGNLSDFETKILKLIKEEFISYPDIGVVSSLPLIYKNALKFKETEKMEKEIASESEFVGTLYERNSFEDVELVMRKYIHRTQSWLYVGTLDKNIIKFFSSEDLTVNNKYNVSGYCKEHRTNDRTKAKETILNRITIN